MTGTIKRRRMPQPLDRHLSEIADTDDTNYVNAGIDSTCARKRSRTIFKLTDGNVILSTEFHSSTGPRDPSSSTVLRNSTNSDRADTVESYYCVHCSQENKVVKAS